MLYNNRIAYIRYDNNLYEKSREKIIKYFRKKRMKVKYEEIKNGGLIVVPKYERYDKVTSKRIVDQINSLIKEHGIRYGVIEEELKFIKKYLLNCHILTRKEINERIYNKDSRIYI